MQLLIEHGDCIYDISGSCTSLTWTDMLNNGASSLEFKYIFDGMMFSNGDRVRLSETDKDGIFYGRIFKLSTSQDKIVTVKAYDQLRYLKAKDTITVDGTTDTINTMLKKMSEFFSFKLGFCAINKKILTASVYTDKTWLDIFYNSIKDILVDEGNYYCLRDEYGSICLRDLSDLQLPLVLGDNSLAYGYEWSKSIDDEYYNQVKIVSGNKTTGKADVYKVLDSDNIEKYGLLQYYEKIDDDTPSATAQKKAELLLKLYNRETESITLSCIGDKSVRAGCSIFGSIQDISLNRRLIVSKVTHTYMPVHTMKVEVIAG